MSLIQQMYLFVSKYPISTPVTPAPKNVGGIVGGVVAAIVAIVVILVIVCIVVGVCCYKRRQGHLL